MRTKIACDVTSEERQLIEKASQIEARLRSQFVKWASLEKAKEIIGQKEHDTNTNNK